jgi:hypothetical protein
LAPPLIGGGHRGKGDPALQCDHPPLPAGSSERADRAHYFARAAPRRRAAAAISEAGAGAWRRTLSLIEGPLAMPVRCLSIGAGSGADLKDPEGVWPIISATEPTGAVLVRPDGHVAWRAQSLPDAAAAHLRATLKRMLCLEE